MYSEELINRRLFAAKKQGLKFNRLPRERSIEVYSKLELLRLNPNGSGSKLPDGQLSRQLNDKEQEFVQSERIISKIDFTYWFTRYYQLDLDPGVSTGTGTYDPTAPNAKIGPPILLPSQVRFIEQLGKREIACHEEMRKYNFTRGILALFHKVRQVAATATARGITLHRMLFWPGTRAFAASIDDVRVNELFRRDHLAIDNLPFWMCPRVYPDVKDKELGFEPPVSSRCVYQGENQQAGGLGVGTQQDVSHLTEVGLWNNPGYIKFSLLPAIPKAITTLLILESTSNGKGNYWHEISEDVRHGREGYEDWIYSFVPWWLNAAKYRGNCPDSWQPKQHTIKHAELIERTSPEFNDGNTYHPSRAQLYWWEKERMAHIRHGELASFLTNFPATPEQSFQSPNNGALPPEFIERLELGVCFPEACYEFDLAGADHT